MRCPRRRRLDRPEVVGQFLSLEAHPDPCKPSIGVLLHFS
jgi:hypothetical protein